MSKSWKIVLASALTVFFALLLLPSFWAGV